MRNLPNHPEPIWKLRRSAAGDLWSCDLPGKKMTDDRSESWDIASDKEGMFCSSDGQTEMEHNSPVDCLLHRSGQTSTEPGRNDIGAKAAISFLVNRLVRIRGYGVSIFFEEKNIRNRTAPT